MDKNYYTNEYYNEKINYYARILDADLNESLLNAYASFCGINLIEVKGAEIPIIVFTLMSFGYLGKSLYDLCKVVEADYRHNNSKGLTKPLRLKRIKEYK
jgi:hypothetical protein